MIVLNYRVLHYCSLFVQLGCLQWFSQDSCHNPFLGSSQLHFLFLKKKTLKQCCFERHCSPSSLRMQRQGRRRFLKFFPTLSLHPTCPQNPDIAIPFTLPPLIQPMPCRQPATLPCRGKVASFPSCVLMEQGRGDSLSAWL